MSFRQSDEDMARINHTLKNKRLSGERIEVAFRTDPEVISGILPPPLESTGTNQVMARITRWVTNYCGTFTMSGLYVDCVHEGLRGEYVLAMLIDSNDAPLLIGREGFGEPKKMGDVKLARSGNSFLGTVDRMGARLMTLEVEAGEDQGPAQGSQDGALYSIKATLALDGGLLGDAYLMAQKIDVSSTENRPGAGRITLGGSPHDPYDEITVREVLSASYAIQELTNTRPAGEQFLRAVIPAADFIPYHYGRLDDWSAHNAFAELGVSRD